MPDPKPAASSPTAFLFNTWPSHSAQTIIPHSPLLTSLTHFPSQLLQLPLLSFAKVPTSHSSPFQKCLTGLHSPPPHPLTPAMGGYWALPMPQMWTPSSVILGETSQLPAHEQVCKHHPLCPLSPPSHQPWDSHTSHQPPSLRFCCPPVPFQSLCVSSSTLSLITSRSGMS